MWVCTVRFIGHIVQVVSIHPSFALCLPEFWIPLSRMSSWLSHNILLNQQMFAYLNQKTRPNHKLWKKYHHPENRLSSLFNFDQASGISLMNHRAVFVFWSIYSPHILIFHPNPWCYKYFLSCLCKPQFLHPAWIDDFWAGTKIGDQGQ